MAAAQTGKRRHKIWLILLIPFIIIILGATTVFFADAPQRRELQAISIGNIDFTKLRDGTYIGEFKASKGEARNASVKVCIAGGEITEIKILKGAVDEKGNPKEINNGMTIDDLFQEVVQSETLKVDAISGATLTSNAHLKALENALKQAQAE